VSTLVEWDDDIPPFEVVMAEAEKARVIRDEVRAAKAAGRAPAPHRREAQRTGDRGGSTRAAARSEGEA
jgi:hypothetical protein